MPLGNGRVDATEVDMRVGTTNVEAKEITVDWDPPASGPVPTGYEVRIGGRTPIATALTATAITSAPMAPRAAAPEGVVHPR